MDNPVRTTHVRVNSKYRTSGNTSNFVCSYNNPELRQVTSLAVVSFTMNRGFFNVQSFNNSLFFNVNGQNIEKRIPVGEYTSETIVAVLDNMFPHTRFSIVNVNQYDSIQVSLVQQSVFPTTVGFDPVRSTLAQTIGLGDNFILTLSSSVYTSPLPLSLDGPGLYVQCRLCDYSVCESSANPNTSSIPLLSKISTSFETSFGDHIVYEPCNPMVHQFASPRSLTTFEVQLTDTYGNIMELPVNVYCDMILKVTYV